MRMPEFDFVEPRTVEEACALLAEDPEGNAVFAGGTDVLVKLRGGDYKPRQLVSLHHIDELHDIGYSEASGLRIGAMVTVNRVAQNEFVQEHYPGGGDADRPGAAALPLGSVLCRPRRPAPGTRRPPRPERSPRAGT